MFFPILLTTNPIVDKFVLHNICFSLLFHSKYLDLCVVQLTENRIMFIIIIFLIRIDV